MKTISVLVWTEGLKHIKKYADSQENVLVWTGSKVAQATKNIVTHYAFVSRSGIQNPGSQPTTVITWSFISIVSTDPRLRCGQQPS